MVCDGEKEFRMRRHQEFLLSSREGTPTRDYGNRTTDSRVEDAIGTRLTHSSQPPDIGQRNPVLGAAESLQRRDVCNMQPVSYGGRKVCFNDTVTVHYVTEWSRLVTERRELDRGSSWPKTDDVLNVKFMLLRMNKPYLTLYICVMLF